MKWVFWIRSKPEYMILNSRQIRCSYCTRTLTRHSWNHYTDCWIVE